MTALERLAAAIRDRHPPTEDLAARLAPCRGRRYPLTLEQYYLQRAAGLAGSWLDQLNDEEIELRLAHDEAAHLEIDEIEDDDGEIVRRRRVSAEELGWTRAEAARRQVRKAAQP